VLRVVALIDGEHYPPVIRDALDQLRAKNNWDVAACLLLGGTEKIKSEEDLKKIGSPVFPLSNYTTDFDNRLAELKPDLVVDLSDEPVIGYRERLRLASRTLVYGAVYQGSDFRFDPPQFADKIHGKPSLTVLGTGKRIGKTAVSSAVSKTLVGMGFDPVVVAMGRGGPEKPELLRREEEHLDAEKLLEYSRAGRHAASDHFENALMSGVTTIGCRRCGGGLAGQTFVSNVLDGAELADSLDNDFVVFDGSGAAIPPVKTDIKLLVLSAAQPLEYFSDYMGPYRIALADVAVLTMAEEPLASAEKVAAVQKTLREINPGITILTTCFRPEPVREDLDLRGKRVFYATTAPAFMQEQLGRYLEEKFGVSIVGMSSSLSNRPKLRADLEKSLENGIPDMVLVELKAAAIDVVVDFAVSNGIRAEFINNIPVMDNGKSFYDELARFIRSKISLKE
jgi:cyclic 2,3-diphosphoglycerate synthetase